MISKSVSKIAFFICSLAIFAAASPVYAYDVLLSISADRSNPVFTDGQTVSGDIYVFVSPESGISKVKFYVDDPAQLNSPFKVERRAPYDLAGTVSDNAKPFDTLLLGDGVHDITAVVIVNSGDNQTINATINVANFNAVLEFTPDTITLEGSLDGPPVSSSVSLTTSDGNSTDYSLSSPTPWLQFSPPSGSTDSLVTISVDPAGLMAGTYTGSLSATAAGYTSAVLSLTFVVNDPSVSNPYSLVISSSANHTNPTQLAGAELSGNAYIFITPEVGITQVRFFLDDPNRESPDQVEGTPPYDFAGTGGSLLANPWNTSTAGDGSHNIQAEVQTSSGTTYVSNADFEINNAIPGSYTLMVSPFPNRSSELPLDGLMVGDEIYVFVQPESDISRVEFFVDDPSMIGAPEQIENQGPYDLGGTLSDGNALPFDTTSLSDGAHNIHALIRRTDNVYEFSDAEIIVSNNDFSLQISPSSLTLGAELDGSAAEANVTITTSDGANPVVTTSSNVAWLTVAPTTGTAPLTIIVHADPAGLTAGAYSGSIDIFASGYAATSLDVTLSVQDTMGAIEVSDTNLQFDMTSTSEGCFPVPCSQILIRKPYVLDFSYPGGPDQSQEIEVTASDGTAVPFTASTNQPWLNVQAADITPATMTINVDPSALGAGMHSGTVTFMAPGYAFAQIYVDVDISSDYTLLEDQDGQWTGFTYFDTPSQSNGYIPGLLNLDPGNSSLEISTTNGLAFKGNNSQDNAIGVGIDAASVASVITTTMSNIPSGSGSYEQGGLWFGVDEDNYNKLVVISSPTGLAIQHLMEVNGQVSASVERSVEVSSNSSLELRMKILPESTQITGEYVINGGSVVEVGAFDAPPEFFSFDAAGIDPLIGTRSFGGIFASHRNGPSSLVYRFDDFSVQDSAGGPVGGPLEFEQSSFGVPTPTSMAWGPDNRLYVTELFGNIHALTYDQDLNVIDDELITAMPDALGARLTLGITFDPISTAENGVLWVSHSSPSTNNGEPNSGTVTRLSGSNFEIVENIITGLPRAIANHAVNSLHFGPDGRLYLAVGGNTGAGAPNTSSSEFGDMEEQPLSAALIVADVYAPDFDGTCNNAANIFGPPPCDVEVFSSGLRNTYDFVFHSNGSIYAPDNGLGVTGTFPPSPTAPCFGFGDTTSWTSGGDNPGTQPDLLNRLEFGRYYGHPNPYRNECVFKDGSYQGVSTPLNYTQPILDLGIHRSANGIIEYPVTGIAGAQLGGDLLIANFSVGNDITRVTLDPGGFDVASTASLIAGFDDPLPLAVNPSGWIFVGELGAHQVTVLRPENTGSWASEAPLPAPRLDAGAASLNGKLYVVGGKDGSTYFPSFFIYDPATMAWSSGPAFPGIAVENPAVTAFDDNIWVFGGSTAPFSNASNQAYSYDPLSSTWAEHANMPTARTGAAVTPYEGNIYVMGGMTSDGASTTTVEIYHPETNSWSTGPDMGIPRDNAFAAVLEGQVFVFGGRTRLADGSTVNGQLNAVEAYSSSNGVWESRAPMPTGRRAFGLGTLNGRVQVFGGESAPNTSGVFDEAEEYDPVTDSWRTLTKMITGRHGAATSTVGTRVFVIGGAPASGSSATTVHESFGF